MQRFQCIGLSTEKGLSKVHVGFDLNRGIPRKVFLTNGNGAKRPFASQILSEGQTGVMERGYQCHKKFDFWQQEDNLFICCIKAGTKKTIIKANKVEPESIIFFDAVVLLGTTGSNQTEKSLRLVGYQPNRQQQPINFAGTSKIFSHGENILKFIT